MNQEALLIKSLLLNQANQQSPTGVNILVFCSFQWCSKHQKNVGGSLNNKAELINGYHFHNRNTTCSIWFGLLVPYRRKLKATKAMMYKSTKKIHVIFL